MARLRPDAFLGGNPWQVLRSMYPKRSLGRENRQFMATYRRHVSEMSWRWQDMRAMYPKSPANRLSGMHRAKILPRRGPFRCTDPSNHARRANLAIRRSAKPTERPRPTAPKRSSGPTAPQHPIAPPGRNIHNDAAPTRLDADPDAPGATAPTPAAANPSGTRATSARHPVARISSSLRRGFASFRRKRAPTIHTYRTCL